MIDKLINSIIRFKRVWGIHIDENGDGSYQIDAVLLENRTGTIYIKEKKQLFELEGLFELLSERTPVALSYTGQKVLYKSSDNNVSNRVEDILHGNDPNEFYCQYFDSVTSRFFAVVRKEHFDPFLQRLSAPELDIISVTLGPGNIASLIPFIGSVNNNVVHAGGFSIAVENGNMVGIKKETGVLLSEILVGEDGLHSDELIPYSNALSVFSKVPLMAETLHSSWEHLIMEVKHKVFFKRAFPLLLSMIFAVLLLSFLILQMQTEKYEDLSAKLADYQEELGQLEKLNDAFKDKQLIQSNLKHGNALFLSFYADRIAESISQNIRLISLAMNPEQKSSAGQKQNFQYEQGKILITGSCASPVDLNEWLVDLKKLEFVKEIENQSYHFDDRVGKGFFDLTLKVGTR